MVVEMVAYPSLINAHVSRQTHILRMTALLLPEEPTDLLICSSSGSALFLLSLSLPSLLLRALTACCTAKHHAIVEAYTRS